MTDAIRDEVLIGDVAANLRGEVAGAAWSFLLPTLELHDIIVLGSPTMSDVATLARLAHGRVTIVVGRQHVERERARLSRARLADRVSVGSPGSTDEAPVDVSARTAGHPPGDDRRPDLVWHVGPVRPNDVARLLSLPGGRAGTRPVMRFAEVRLPDVDRRSAVELDRSYLLLPGAAHLRVAAPLAEPGLIEQFDSSSRGLPPLRSVRRLSGGVGGRRGTVGALLGVAPTTDPPEYIVEAAARAGIDLAGSRWAVRTGGEFNSQKIVFAIAGGRGSTQPDLIVKMTRDPKLNPRLDIERATLDRVATLAHLDAGRAPSVLFASSHAGLAIVGETFARGTSLSQAFTGSVDDQGVADAIGWLEDLAGASEHRCDPDPRPARLAYLLERFIEIYRPSSELTAFMGDQVDALVGIPRPCVLQHGDPGAWNLRVEDGKVHFLDWEAADVHGEPLWDLFYLLRSIAVLVPSGLIPRRRLARIRRQFLTSRAFQDVAASAISGQKRRLGLPEDVVEPLFFTCWMHRAVKEASRLTPERLWRGHYVRLLAAFAMDRDQPALRRLLGG